MKTKLLNLLVIFLLLVSPLVGNITPVLAATEAASLNVTLVGQLGGESYAAEACGAYALLGVGPRVVIVNTITNPANPQMVGQTIPLDGIVEGIKVDDVCQYAYVAAGEGGFYILNISNPANPTVSGHVTTGGYSKAVDFYGNFAYVADGLDGLVKMNITNKAAPTYVTAYATADSAEDVDVYAESAIEVYAFVASGTGGLEILDALTMGLDASYTTGIAYAQSVSVDPTGLFVYIADYDNFLVHALDVSILPLITLANTVSTAGSPEEVITRLSGAQTFLFVAESSSGLRMLDVTTPDISIPTLGTVNTPGWATAVSSLGNYAYVADSWTGLQVIQFQPNLTPPPAYTLTLLGAFSGLGAVRGVTTPPPGDVAFSAGAELGMFSVDVASRANPAVSGWVDTPGFAERVSVNNGFAFIADGYNGLQAVNIDPPTSPVVTDFILTNDYAADVYAEGDYAYVADGFGGLYIATVSNPLALTLAAAISAPASDYASGLAKSGNYIYLADNFAGLQVFNVSTAEAPTWVSTLAPLDLGAASAVDVAAWGTYAYVAAGTDGLVVVDMSDPNAPNTVGSVVLPGYAISVQAAGHFAIVSDSTSGVYVVDARTPAAPVIAGYYDTAGDSMDASVAGAIYAANDNGGLYILDYDFPEGDLSITKTDGQTSVIAGTDLVYTITVSNVGFSDITGAVVTDNFPAALTGTYWTCTAATGSSCGATFGFGNINTTANLPYNGNVTFVVNTTVASDTAAGSLANTASVAMPAGVTDLNAADNSATDTDTVETAADLEITKTGPLAILAGQQMTYDMYVDNFGPSDASSVLVTDTLPADTTFVSATAGCTETAGVVACAIPSLQANSFEYITVTVNVGAGAPLGPITNTVVVASATYDAIASNNSSSASTNVTLEADLSILKSAPATDVAGTALTYNFTVSNAGPTNATGVTLADSLPLGVTYTGSSFACTDVNGEVSCALGTINAGSTLTGTITVAIDPDTRGVITNTASVSGNEYDGSTANNTSSGVATTVSGEVDLSITKTDTPDPVLAGNNVTYNLTATNNGPSTATSLVVTDTLPAAVSFVSASPACSYNDISHTVTCTQASLDVAADAQFSIVAGVASDNTAGLSNSAEAASAELDSTPGNNTSTATTAVNTSADLSITKIAVPSPVNASGLMTYTVTVSNAGPSDATAVVITDTLSPDVTFQSASAGCAELNGVVTCDVATLASGANTSVDIHVSVDATTGQISNTAEVTSAVADPTPANNSTTINTTVNPVADLSITKSGDPASVHAGTNVTYTLTVVNNGPSVADSVSVVDTLPAGTTFVSASVGCAHTTGSVMCGTANLGLGTPVTFTIVATVNSGTAAGIITNSATVSSGAEDDNTANNTATADTTVTKSADLSVAKLDIVDPAIAGLLLSYDVTVTNHGPSDAGSWTLTDNLPPQAAFVSVDSLGCNHDGSTTGGAILCHFASLGATGTKTIRVVVSVDRAYTGVMTNSVSVTSANDGNAANDSIDETTTIESQVDLSITKSDSVDPVNAGEQLTYQLSVTNAGPSVAHNVVVSDSLPASAGFVAASAGCTHNLGVVTCSAASMPLTTNTYTVTVLVDPAAQGTLTNVASVTSASVETDAADNQVQQTTQVAQEANLEITKTDNATAAVPGEVVTYTIHVVNHGPSSITGATVEDTLPAILLNAAWTCTASAGSVCPASGSGNINATVDLTAGGDATFTVVAGVSSTATGLLSNTATVTAPAGVTDPDVNNNSATDVDSLGATADVTISMTDTPDPVYINSQATYELTITNNGPSAATGVTVQNFLPTGVTFVSAAGCTLDGSVVTCNVGVLDAGESTVITIVVQTTAAGTITNVATVFATNDGDTSNNSTSAQTLVRYYVIHLPWMTH